MSDKAFRMFSRRAVTAGLALAPFGARAQDYPQGVIRFVCPFAAGSGADIKCRWYAPKLADALKRTVVVENRPGAFGNIATETVAKSKPDGLTLYVAPGASVLAASPHLFKKLPFDPINDFEHITTLNTSAFVLAVSGASPFRSVAELTAFLREKGEKGSYGSIANPGLVSSELYKAAFGLKTQEIKYRDTGPMLNDLITGQLDFFHVDATVLPSYLESGKLRALATGSAEKLASMPQIPGAREAGIPNSDIRTWWSVHAPAKTPKAICDRLEEAFNVIAVAPDTVKFLAGTGSDPLPGNSKMLRELLLAETKAWEGYVRLAKIEPQ
jgi:tripartite-type tricarboxylate transporter receptor subunit TctC